MDLIKFSPNNNDEENKSEGNLIYSLNFPISTLKYMNLKVNMIP